jgi:hypothetical protein
MSSRKAVSSRGVGACEARAASPRRRVAGVVFGALLGLLAVALALAMAICVPFVASADILEAGRADAAGQHADAKNPGAVVVGASPDDGTADAAAEDPTVAKLRQTARELRELSSDRLASSVTPQSLFDVPLDDDAAVGLEELRLRALLRDADSDGGARRDAGVKRAARDAGLVDTSPAEVPPALWQARLDVDRARLAFYTLSSARRHDLLALHSQRSKVAGAPSEAEQREKAAQARRDEALKAAHDARSETERVVREEYARLLDVESAQAAYEKKLGAEREAIGARREATLVWQRRAREARGASSPPDRVDATYDDLRKALRSARDGLDVALGEVNGDASGVPDAGADSLADLQGSVDTTAAREERKRVNDSKAHLVTEQQALREQRASQLLDEIDTLNGERLALLSFLSSAKRSAITGFTAEGVDQAASEVRQLTLIARYHRYAAVAWLSSLRHGNESIGLSAGGVLLVVLEWLAAIGAFFWARPRIRRALQSLRARAQESDRLERLTTPSLATRVSAFAIQVHRPIVWLALALMLSWLLPANAKGLLEVQLVTVVVEWILGGALIVVVVNALAAAGSGVPTEDDTPALRLRSLRLVGRVVVAFGLVLVLTSRLVGPGTIYQWVSSTCWFTSIPVLLVLVRWWRDVVFRRAERARRKSSFELWVLANRSGWKSFLAATAGGVYLFVTGAVRAVRGWVGRFNVTRRVLAYLFRRELGKLEAERADLGTSRLPDLAFEALGPEAVGDEWIATAVDEELDKLRERLRERRGGVIALVAPRGMGKTVLLRSLHREFPDTALLQAPKSGPTALRAALADKLKMPSEASLEEGTAALAASPIGRALFLDDAHRFVQPMMGGLATFDALLAAASANATKTTWVFAIDEVLWLFLQRARGARPLFDEVIRLYPWREEQIIDLLRERTAQAGVRPTFERLLEKLPPTADDVDKQEALDRRAASYYRLLWDYAAGNPGVALHMWRRSIGADEQGGTHVRFFQAPETADFEVLPDPALFVLRAVLQLAPASPDEIRRATRLGVAEVTEALRYAKARSYVEEEDGRYTVSWTWLRALTLFLQRRHLLVTS